MKKLSCIVTLVLLNFFPAAYGSMRVALVIGNSLYQNSPLENPAKDAQLIANTLRQLDFDVEVYLDTDQKTMKTAIKDFGDRLDSIGKDAVGLFYYAGHGIQVNGENYLIPVNAAINRERDVSIEAVAMSTVLTTLDYARNNLNFVIMDACRNNPFARSFRSAASGLARMDAPRGTLVAYATAPGDVASDGEGENSPYSSALAYAMAEAGIPVEQMFKRIRRNVMAETRNLQVPWESSSLTGDFFFRQSTSLAADPGQAIQLEIDKETLFWQSIKDSQQQEDYEEYLRHFPGGIFSGLARNRIASIMLASAAADKKAVAHPIKSITTEQLIQPESQKSDTEDQAETETSKTEVLIAEQEPNNSIGIAQRIPVQAEISGRINPKGDVDWYHLEVRQQGALHVNITEVAAELDVVFRVWNYEYQTLSAWYSPLRSGAETSAVIDLPLAGDYYLEVRDGRNDAKSEQAYRLLLGFSASGDIYEPNNGFGSAAEIAANDQWRATILPKADVDWYRLQVENHGELKVSMLEVPEGLDVMLRLWNADKQVKSGWYSPLRVGGDTIALMDLPYAGNYFLEVRDGRDDARAHQSFLIKTAYKASPDRFEPNNSLGRAASLAIGELVRGTILPKGDIDWFSVDVDEQGELQIAVTQVPEKLDIVYRVWNDDATVISGWLAPLRAGGDTIHNIDLPNPGRYFIEVRDSRDDQRSVEAYAIELNFVPSKDRGEPNNSFGTALSLKLGVPMKATILPRGDSDWYRVSLAQAGTIKLQINDMPADLDVVMRVWNNEKKLISGWFAPLRPGGDNQGEVSIPAAGHYFIEVRDGRDDARSTTAYQLLVDMDGG